VDTDIFLLLLQDGLTTGAIYVLLAVGLLIVFSVTRVMFIPQGEFVAYGALTVASLSAGRAPPTLWLLDIGLAAWAAFAIAAALIRHQPIAWHKPLLALLYAAALTALVYLLPGAHSLPWLMLLLSIGIVAPMAPLAYRFAYQPLADAAILVLLLLSMALHLVMQGIGLVMFGAEGVRTAPLVRGSFPLGGLDISGQSICIAVCCLVLVGGLRWLFQRTMLGKALRAAASDRLGARLMGIDAATTGQFAFLLAGITGALAGALIGPLTPIYYDTGFTIGLKGFVAAIIGGLVSYPAAALGALGIGLIESFANFWISAYSPVIFFGLLIPVLVVLSIATGASREDA
jgi:branched-chain amino acid transport system permease protein